MQDTVSFKPIQKVFGTVKVCSVWWFSMEIVSSFMMSISLLKEITFLIKMHPEVTRTVCFTYFGYT